MLPPKVDSEHAVKHQYVGDINDYRKYALLRALSANGHNRIGVCWMLTPDDGGVDGGKLGYLQQPERFRLFDPELFDILAHAASEPDRRRLQTIEGVGRFPALSIVMSSCPTTCQDALLSWTAVPRNWAIQNSCSSIPTMAWRCRCPRGAKTRPNTHTYMRWRHSTVQANRC